MSTIPVKDAKNPQTTSNKRTFPPKKLTLTITSNQPDLVQSQLEVPDKMSCHPLLNQESDEEEERKSDKTRMKRISEDVVTSKSVSVSTQVSVSSIMIAFIQINGSQELCIKLSSILQTRKFNKKYRRVL